MRNVREQADVVLYLVNAAEDPRRRGLRRAGDADPRMDRQAGDRAAQPDRASRARARSSRPRRRAGARISRGTASCATSSRSTPSRAAGCRRSRCCARSARRCRRRSARRSSGSARRGRTRRMAAFEASIEALAGQLARAACDREPLDDAGRCAARGARGYSAARWRAGRRRTAPPPALAERLDADVRATTDRLIEIHGLEGRASAEVLARLAGDFAVAARVSEGKAAMLGGIVSGALSGLAADLATGGLTFGAGLLTGGLLGALGAAGLARGYNLVRGDDETVGALERGVPRRVLRLGAAPLSRGRALRARARRVGRGRASGVLARRGGGRPRVAPRRARGDLGGACRRVRRRRGSPRRCAVELGAAALELLERLYPGALDDRRVSLDDSRARALGARPWGGPAGSRG